jgi:hypothetical protein
MGRIPREINWDIVERFLESGSNGVEIADELRMCKQTFYARFEQEYGVKFQEYLTEHPGIGDAKLKRMLYEKTLNNKAPGNATLLMFMARCRLGMKEPEMVHLVAANQTQIDESQLIMQLQHENAELKANANKPEAE